jgi:dienelactone hydrolase
MPTEEIAYSADGVEMQGFLATPAGGGRGPAVLVAHEAPGLTDHCRDRARRLADLGYIAFALDAWGDGRLLTVDEARPLLIAWIADPTGLRVRMRAALDVLSACAGVDPSRVAAIGHCFGAYAVLELARTGADLAGVVGFHPGLPVARPDGARRIKGKVLMCVGAQDPLLPAEQRAAFEAEMIEARVDWRLNVYGQAQHSFSNPTADATGIPGLAYHAETDRRSWRAMLDLFAETIGVP